jgi:hypothetical protein
MPDKVAILKIKLDMVYRKLDLETAKTRFAEKTNPPVTPVPS